MLDRLQTIAEREQLLLSPLAMFSVQSRGRKHAEPEHPYRGPFQRDRDRIVHSAAFRRLSGKMQVFTGDMGDYHRTRLTHTHEVASIARTLGRALRLNEDLIEALALFHDIGHPPFGHSGEAALDECLQDEGGFSHNRYALTLAEELEERYFQFPGLNLTYEVLESQATRIDKLKHTRQPIWETQVVDVADSITYDAHDTDDAVKLGLVTIDELTEIPLVRQSIERVRQRVGTVTGDSLRSGLVHELIDRQVGDVLATALNELDFTEPSKFNSPDSRGQRLGTSANLSAEKAELERFLYEHVYRHPRLMSIREEAQRRLRTMFQGYVDRPTLLAEKFRRRAESVGMRRATGEYLAGMTDRYCDQQFQRHFAAK